jgi:para-aminobenzoate synthetase component 1
VTWSGATPPQGCLALSLPWVDPAHAFARWANDPHLAWLDSQGPASGRGGTSYLAIEPFEVLRPAPGHCPFAALGDAMAAWRFAWPGAPVAFIGGAVGFLSYEAGAALEGIDRPGAATVPDACFGLYDLVLAFDHASRRAWLLSSGLPERQPSLRASRARARADAALARLAGGAASPPPLATLAWREETSRAAHMARVARTVAYVESGDICQANITARFLADRPAGASAAAIHLALRAANPAPYGAYLSCGPALAIASASPERFLGLTAQGAIEARPIKGTRPRGRDAAEDGALAAELRASAKDRAENLMIVDLLRHDIGRVASIGSVTVPQLAALETFANVHHLVSVVRGALRPGLAAVDLLRAAFPGGSITGAPKRRAMEVIRELEPAPRGAYCGAVAWLGWDGAMDSSIAIRTLTVAPDLVVAQAGGGITADSDPAEEYEEMLVKIRPLLRALGPFAG